MRFIVDCKRGELLYWHVSKGKVTFFWNSVCRLCLWHWSFLDFVDCYLNPFSGQKIHWSIDIPMLALSLDTSKGVNLMFFVIIRNLGARTQKSFFSGLKTDFDQKCNQGITIYTTNRQSFKKKMIWPFKNRHSVLFRGGIIVSANCVELIYLWCS